MPLNSISSQTIVGKFLYPDDIGNDPLYDYEMGGIALQNASQGLRVQPWQCHWDPEDSNVYLTPNINGTPIQIQTHLNVLELSFAFDQNMRWVLALLVSGNILKFYWFDSDTQSYIISVYNNVRSVKLALDDKRSKSVDLDKSDVILTYIKSDGDLVTRVQRERYLIEHVQASDIPVDRRITHFGMTDEYRLQWRIISPTG